MLTEQITSRNIFTGRLMTAFLLMTIAVIGVTWLLLTHKGKFAIKSLKTMQL